MEAYSGQADPQDSPRTDLWQEDSQWADVSRADSQDPQQADLQRQTHVGKIYGYKTHRDKTHTRQAHEATSVRHSLSLPLGVQKQAQNQWATWRPVDSGVGSAVFSAAISKADSSSSPIDSRQSSMTTKPTRLKRPERDYGGQTHKHNGNLTHSGQTHRGQIHVPTAASRCLPLWCDVSLGLAEIRRAPFDRGE